MLHDIRTKHIAVYMYMGVVVGGEVNVMVWIGNERREQVTQSFKWGFKKHSNCFSVHRTSYWVSGGELIKVTAERHMNTRAV